MLQTRCGRSARSDEVLKERSDELCDISSPNTVLRTNQTQGVRQNSPYRVPVHFSPVSGRFLFFFFFYVYAPNSKEETRRSSENQRKRKNAEEVISTEHECPTGRSCGGRRESDARGLIFRFIVDAQLDGRQSSSFPSLLDATCWKAMRRHLLAENAEEGRREKKKKKISIPVLAWAGSGGGSWNSQRSFGQVPNMNCKSVGAMELATLSGS